MSRSFKKTPIIGHSTSDSEKECKKIWHRSMRRKEKSNIKISIKNGNAEGHISLVVNDIISTWDMAKDGKHYWSEKQRLKRLKEGHITSNYIRKCLSK